MNKENNKPLNTKDKSAIVSDDVQIIGKVGFVHKKYFVFVSLLLLAITISIFLAIFVTNKNQDSYEVYHSVKNANNNKDCNNVINESNKYFNRVNKQDGYMVLIADIAYDCAIQNDDWTSAKLYTDKVIALDDGAIKQKWQERKFMIDASLYQAQMKQKLQNSNNTQGVQDGPIL